MAIVAPLNWYAMDSKVGQGLNQTYPQAASVPDVPALPFALGETCFGNNGSRWMFVRASTTVTAGNLVSISPQFKANNLTQAVAISAASAGGGSTDILIGVAQFGGGTIMAGSTQQVANGPTTGVTDGDAFWACLEAASGLQFNVNSTGQPASVLYVSSTVPGSVQSTATTAPLIGIWLNTAFTASGSNTVADGFMRAYVRATTT